MKYVYGRYYFDKMDRAINCTKVYAAFLTKELAEEYHGVRMADFAPNSVDFIFDGEKLLFRLDKVLSANRKWASLENTIVYDCTKDADVALTNYMVSEKDIINAVKELIS